MIASVPFIDIHTHQISAFQNGEVSILNWMPLTNDEAAPKKAYSLGVHPRYIDSHWPLKLARLEELLQTDPHLLAIGETGLDKWSASSIEEQELVLRTHIALAEKYQKPLIVHCVRSHENLLRLLKSMAPSIPLVLHGFNQKWALAEKFVKTGWHLSLGPALGREQSNAAICIQKLGLTGPFFLETDNQEQDIEQVYQWAAELLQTDIEILKAKLVARFDQIFQRIP